MEGHAKQCVERYCELANKTTQQLHKVSTPCIDDHHVKEEELKSVGELSKECSQIVLKCLYSARIGRPDILWSVNKLARAVTQWSKACDKRLSRLILHIHHTCAYRQYCLWETQHHGIGFPRHARNRRQRTREGPELACANTLSSGVAHAGGKDELTSCCVRHVVRGRQSSLILEVRLGEHASLVGGNSACTRPSAPGWAGCTPPHGDGSMHSQANARASKVLRPPIPALPSVIVVTKKVLREADGPVEMSALTLPSGGKVRSRVRLEGRSGVPVRSPKNISDSMVSEQTCTIDRKMDQSWQTIISFDLLHSSFMWIQTVLSRGKHCQTMQTGTVSRLRLCRRSWGFKIYIRWNIVLFWKSYVCINQLDVRNKLQFRKVQQNQKSFRWMQDWGWMVYPYLIYGIWPSQFLETRIRVIKHGETCVRTNVRVVQHSHSSKTKEISWNDWWFGQRWFYFLKHQFFSPGSFVVCGWRKRSSDQDHSKGKEPDMFPEPAELLLIGCSTIWTPKSKSNTLTPKTNSQTQWPREISHVMNGIIFCVCSTLAISVLPIVLKWCRKEHKKMQVKKQSQQYQSRWWIWSRDAAKGILMCLPLLHHKARWKPDMKVKYFWACWMSII